MAEDLYLRFAALLAAALLVPSVTFAMFAVVHKDMPFWRYASAGLFLIFAASALSALRDVLPALVSLMISNLLVGAGYYLCLKSVRSVYNFGGWKYLEEATLTFYVLAAINVNLFYNTYENRVVAVSAGIVILSLLSGLIAYLSQTRENHVGRMLLIVFAVANATISTGRLLAAFSTAGGVFSIGIWDPVFFTWSIAATFLFALAQFINGNTHIQREHLEALQETKQHLEYERELSGQLAMANDEQQNLQKLLLHEFKRPLSAIQAALQAQSIKDAAFDQAKLGRLKALTSQATTYLEGISQYQDISELFATPNWSHASVADVAQDILTKWGVEVSVGAELSHQELSCDPLLIDIALSNLIENAKKFGRGIEGVSVRLGSADGKLQIDVQDDGPGIPQPEWSRVWRKFYKLDSETPNALTGCGLGLHIVAQVANAHGGSANVVSEKPSVIRLELPLTFRDGSDG